MTNHVNRHYYLREFADRDAWVAWRNDIRKTNSGKEAVTKVPYCGVYAKAESDNPNTWVTLDTANQIAEQILTPGKTGGIGIIIGIEAAEGLILGGIDLDTCIGPDGMADWARDVIGRFNSYTEVSPSQTGAKILFLYRREDQERIRRDLFHGTLGKEAKVKNGNAHPPGIEVYLARRYFTITAQSEGFAEVIRIIDYEDMEWLVQSVMPRITGQTRRPSPLSLGKSSNGTAAPAKGKDESRSGFAFRKVQEWLRRAKIHTQVEMVQMLLHDPQTTDWARDYEDEPTQRQFTRLWERAQPEPGSVDATIAEMARTFKEEKKAGGEVKSEDDSTAESRDPAAGEFHATRERLVLDQSAPSENARILLLQRKSRLIHWRGDFLEWTGTHYRIQEDVEIERQLYEFLDSATTTSGKFRANRSRVGDTLHALRALTLVPSYREQWSEITTGWVNEHLVCFANGVLDLDQDELLDHRDDVLVLNSLPFEYTSEAHEPVEWLRFLRSLWPDEPEYIGYLQEIIGYLVSGRTDLHKIFVFQGPPRCGKGTIAAIMRGLLGSANVSSIQLARLAEQFALQSAIGKSAIIIGDARLPTRTDLGRLTEILLNISGQDLVAVPRKYRDDWIGPIAARVVIMSNLSPRFVDESAAIATRLIPVVIKESFLNREDLGLLNRLQVELPSLMAWSIQGLRRLTQRGHFIVPESAQLLVQEARDAASPISMFIDECCICNPDASVSKKMLYDRYQSWCLETGHHPASDAKFAMDLRALLPRLRQTRAQVGGQRLRYWEGIRLNHAHVTDE